MSTLFGYFNDTPVTVNGSQTIAGKKRFINSTNDFSGFLNQPTVKAGSTTITPTVLSYLNGLSSNAQQQIDGINIVLTGLTALEQALVALEPAPNATTVQFNDSILLDNGLGNTITAGSNQINFVSSAINPSVISNSSGQDMNVASSNNLNLSATNDIILSSDALGTVNLNALNINSYGYATPFCFTRERSNDSFTYNLGGQTWENVKDFDLNVPYQFFTETPQVGYTSTKWKIDFALNCFNNSNIGDKGLALYVDFYDNSAANFISPQAYNLNTPYAVYQTASNFTNTAQPPFQNFNWSDVVDFGVLSGTGSGNVPLHIRLWVAGDSGFNCNFNMVVSLTRTNLL
jgi:hypothetical protein